MNVLFFYTEILVFIGESLFFNNDLHEIELSLLLEDKRMLGKNKEACRLLKIAKRVKKLSAKNGTCIHYITTTFSIKILLLHISKRTPRLTNSDNVPRYKFVPSLVQVRCYMRIACRILTIFVVSFPQKSRSVSSWQFAWQQTARATVRFSIESFCFSIQWPRQVQ